MEGFIRYFPILSEEYPGVKEVYKDILSFKVGSVSKVFVSMFFQMPAELNVFHRLNSLHLLAFLHW